MDTNHIKTNSIKAWFLAARPKTLTGALVPVAIALAMAWHDNQESFKWTPALLCMLFACMMQIDANFVNDYYDCLKGIDGEDRLGPERACSQGWITLPAMKKGLIIVTIISALIGLPLIAWGGWQMVGIGMACIIFCFLYTTLLSSMAMGDVLVLLFFGIVPVCATYYLQTGTVTTDVLLLSLGCGLATDNLLIVNNFRDRDTDKRHGKITLVTLVGERCALALYPLLFTSAAAIAFIVVYAPTFPSLKILLLVLYLIFCLSCFIKMKRIRRGRQLNQVLGQTALSILLYGIAVCLGVLL